MTDYATKIVALEEAMASGELTVESDGERVTYRSIADIRLALDYLRQQQAATATPRQRPATTLASYCPD